MTKDVERVGGIVLEGRAFIGHEFRKRLFPIGIPCRKIMSSYHGCIYDTKVIEINLWP